MYMCSKAFSNKEELTSNNCDCTGAKTVNNGTSSKSNGAIIFRDHRNYTITEELHIKKLNTLDITNALGGDFVADRARGA